MASGYVVRIDGKYYAEDPTGAAYTTRSIINAALFDERTAKRVAQLQNGIVEDFVMPASLRETNDCRICGYGANDCHSQECNRSRLGLR